MYRYVFEGQVSESNHLITNRWRGETWANSEAKASNRPSMAKVVLHGPIVKAS